MPSLLAPMPSSLATACFFSPGRPRSHPPALPIPLPSQVTVSLPRGIHPPSPGNQIPICCGETPCLGCSPASTAIFPCSPCPLEPPKLLCCAKLPSRALLKVKIPRKLYHSRDPDSQERLHSRYSEFAAAGMEGGGRDGWESPRGAAAAAAAADSFTVEEWRGSSSMKLTRTAVLNVSDSSLSLLRLGSPWNELRRKIVEAFVPEGFPGSVTHDYLPFQIWDSLQGLSTYIRAMLSTQALLSAIGVGEKSATVIGATFQWFLRDFTGMLGGILFTFYQGSNLDSNAKMWRLVADFMNDLGMLMDLISPLFPSALIAIVCLGSLSRSFTGVASGATRAALTQHFSLENNAADISAKEGSQETVATMIGMALGMLLAHIIRDRPFAIWFSFLSLTVFHMFANYRAVRSLSLTTLNDERTSLLLQHFMKTGQVLSPQQVSAMEHVFPSWIYLWSPSRTEYLHKRIHLGVKISSLKHYDVMELSRLAGSHYRKERYLLLERKGAVHVVMHRQSTPADVLQSFIHALVVAILMDNKKFFHPESHLWMGEYYPIFISKLKSSGWTTERLLSHSIIWKAQWVHGAMDEKLK